MLVILSTEIVVILSIEMVVILSIQMVVILSIQMVVILSAAKDLRFLQDPTNPRHPSVEAWHLSPTK